MQKLIRAVAWAWAWRANRSPAAIALPNGVRASPKCAAHGARLAIAVLLGPSSRRAAAGSRVKSIVAPVAGFLVVGGGDHAEVVDPGRGPPPAAGAGRRRGARAGRSRTAPRPRPACRPGTPRSWPGSPGRTAARRAGPVSGGIDGVGVAFQRNGRDPGHPPGHRPAERLPDQRRVRPAACGPPAWNRSMGACPVSACTRRLATCSAHAANQSLSWSSDSMPVVARLGQERLPDIPVGSFLFSPPLRRVRLAVDQADAEHRARPRQPRVRERRPVIAVQDVRYAPSGDRAAQQLLADAGVLPVDRTGRRPAAGSGHRRSGTAGPAPTRPVSGTAPTARPGRR